MTLPSTYIEGFHSKTEVEKMTYSQLGATDIKISKLGIGGGAYSGFYGEFDEAEAAETVEFGLKMGINYIDTAPYYGAGRSETVLGKALKSKNIPRESFYISTKVGRYISDWATLDYSKQRVQKSVDESLERLGLKYLDIVIVHDVEFANKKQVVNETLPALQELVKQGKIRYLGVSGYPLSDIWEVVSTSSVRVDVIITYARDTLIDSTLNDYMPRLKERQIGVISASPTGCQLLTNKGPEQWHPANERIRQICKRGAEYCEKNGVELGTLAVSYALTSPNTTVCLVGAVTSQIMKDNLNLLCIGLSPKESSVLNYLKENVFSAKDNLNWEGVEIEIFKKHMASIGKPVDYL
ncbi:Aldo/keto reductase family [Nesidiocoris tenuis]|uniref:Aldo/keto reductase family n=1 Tax=Nesidiocoris tenuis TaxID=355587 RepID=A0ABN7AQT0_9HEMI|nr:Aldo/keto reductase family [Nesidiocoris tenuis]